MQRWLDGRLTPPVVRPSIIAGVATPAPHATHLMAAFKDGSIKLSKRVVGEAIEKAWPSLFHDVEDTEEKQWQHCMHMLEDKNVELRDSIESMRESLGKSREAFTEKCK